MKIFQTEEISISVTVHTLFSFNSFYRFVLEPELTLTANDVAGPVAKFLDIPESPLLTLNMITPEGWLVETVHSNCDLDNIHLKDVSYHKAT